MRCSCVAVPHCLSKLHLHKETCHNDLTNTDPVKIQHELEPYLLTLYICSSVVLTCQDNPHLPLLSSVLHLKTIHVSFSSLIITASVLQTRCDPTAQKVFCIIPAEGAIYKKNKALNIPLLKRTVVPNLLSHENAQDTSYRNDSLYISFLCLLFI